MSIRIGIGLDVLSSAGVDADALAFFARVTAAGGTLSGTEKIAVNKLVLDMKAANIWTSMKAVYPMVGSSAAACAQNLISASFTGSFFGGWTYASTGITGNGTNAYMDTNIASTSLSLINFSWGMYSRTNKDAIEADLGLGSSELITNSGGLLYSDLPDSTGRFTASNTDTRGFFSICNNSTDGYKIYKNGSNLASTVYNIKVFQLFNMIIGAFQAGGTRDRFSTRQNAFTFVGTNLPPTQNTNFYTAVQAFQTTLSRQV